MKKEIYISSALSGSLDLPSAKRFYEKLQDVCLSLNFNTFLPHLDSVEPVYDFDRKMLSEIGIILVDLSEPSHGVGLELGEFAPSKFVLAICSNKANLSKYLLGFLEKEKIKVHYYSSQDEAIGFVKGYLTRLGEELGENLK